MVSLSSFLHNVASCCLPSAVEVVPYVSEALIKAGIASVVDVSYLRSASASDYVEVFGNGWTQVQWELVRVAAEKAYEYRQGWATLQVRNLSTSAASSSSDPLPLSSVPAKRSLARVCAAERRISRLALRLATGHADHARTFTAGNISHRKQDDTKMQKVLGTCHDFFLSSAQGVVRHDELSSSEDKTQQSLALQDDCYRSGSRSWRVVESRLRVCKSFVADMRQKSIDYLRPSEWDVATWLRIQRSKGKSVPNKSYHALKWLETIFGISLHTSAALVVCQSRVQSDRSLSSLPKQAIMPSEDVIRGLEAQITDAPTGVLRCMAGVCALAAHASGRGYDLIRSRDVQLSQDAIYGLALMKSSVEYSLWVARRLGFAREDWAQDFLLALAEHHLPGDDFLVYGVNADCSAFVERVAETDDVQRAYQMLLQLPPINFTSSEAVEYTFHGLRHSYVTAQTQFDASAPGLEDMGHWEPGSKMPARYNSRACVRELKLRNEVVMTVRDGWRVADPFCLPHKRVTKKKRKRSSLQCPKQSAFAVASTRVTASRVGRSCAGSRGTSVAHSASVVPCPAKSGVPLCDASVAEQASVAPRVASVVHSSAVAASTMTASQKTQKCSHSVGTSVAFGASVMSCSNSVCEPGSDVVTNVRYVMAVHRDTVHAWISGDRSACNKYRTGTPQSPTSTSVFLKPDLDLSGLLLCKVCMSLTYNRLQRPALTSPREAWEEVQTHSNDSIRE